MPSNRELRKGQIDKIKTRQGKGGGAARVILPRPGGLCMTVACEYPNPPGVIARIAELEAYLGKLPAVLLPVAMKLLFLFLISLTTFAHGASFDCAKSRTRVEKLICGSDSLSRLDETLADLYGSDQEDAAGPIRAAQKAWLELRNRCGDAACIEQRYEERIEALACVEGGRWAGSAIGSSQCWYFQTRLAERQLAALQQKFASQVLAESDNKPYVEEILVAEDKAWRGYRNAQCALHGAREGGSDGWKNAWAALCGLEETQKRIAHLKEETQAK